MKLFFLIESLYRAAGTERIATDVVNALYENTHWDVYFITVSSNTDSYFKLNKTIPVLSLQTNIKKPWIAIRHLRRLIKQERPNYLINIAIPMSYISLPANFGLKCKIINWEHFNLYERALKWYFPRLIAAIWSHKTIVLTKKDKNSYPLFLQHKIQTIYNFSTLIHDIPSPLKSNIAISIGRLTYQKGFDLLIDAWKIVTERNKEWQLYIIGNGEDEQKLKEKVKSYNLTENIHFLSATPNIIPYYQKASLYIMSSRFEGLPLVLIEAKSFCLPCISFTCPNGPDEIIRNNIDGKLVPLGDTNKLAETILEVITNRNMIKNFGKGAIEDINKRFSKDHIINQWIKLLS